MRAEYRLECYDPATGREQAKFYTTRAAAEKMCAEVRERGEIAHVLRVRDRVVSAVALLEEEEAMA